MKAKWSPERAATNGARWTPERQQEARTRYEEGASLDEIAVTMKTSTTRATQAIRAAGGTMRRRGARTEKNCFWRGGRVVDVDGYILLKVPGHPHATASGYVREHRLVMEQSIGRHLTRSEVVHHRNGVNDDNRLENLELFESNATHLAHELRGRCPKWSSEGKARILASVRSRPKKARMTREQVNARAREPYAKRQAARQSAQP